MKIVCSTDWHGDRETLGVPRHQEVRAAVMKSVHHAIELNADAYLFLGDLADPDSGGLMFEAVDIAFEAALALEAEQIRSIWLTGNHDVNEDGSGTSCLSPLGSYARRSGSYIVVANAPGLYEVAENLGVLCLPYTPISHSYDPAAYACKVFDELPVFARVVVAGHLMIDGVAPGEETTELPRGRDIAFPIAETERAVLRLNGHYHRRQTTADGIVIPGALARLSFGEQDHEPGYLVVTI